MRYVLLVSNNEDAPISPAERSRREAAFVQFQSQVKTRSATVLGARIDASGTTTTVRCWEGGDVIVSAGSNPVPGEQLTGVFVVDCANLDETIDFATTIPTAWYGTVVVNTVMATAANQEDRLTDDEDKLAILAAG